MSDSLIDALNALAVTADDHADKPFKAPTGGVRLQVWEALLEQARELELPESVAGSTFRYLARQSSRFRKQDSALSQAVGLVEDEDVEDYLQDVLERMRVPNARPPNKRALVLLSAVVSSLRDGEDTDADEEGGKRTKTAIALDELEYLYNEYQSVLEDDGPDAANARDKEAREELCQEEVERAGGTVEQACDRITQRHSRARKKVIDEINRRHDHWINQEVGLSLEDDETDDELISADDYYAVISLLMERYRKRGPGAGRKSRAQS